MSNWRPFTANMPPGIPDALSAVGQASSTLSQLLDALAELLDALSQVTQFMGDALQTAIAALCAIIQGLIDQIENLLDTGVYFYLDKGRLFTSGKPDGLSGFLDRWKTSFDDEGDRYRPQFAGSASISAMFFLVGANDLPEISRQITLLGELFGVSELVWKEEMQTFDLPAHIESGMSTPPDWKSVQLREVLPPFVTLGETLQRALGAIEVADSYSGMFSELAKVIAAKAEMLRGLNQEIQELVDSMNALIGSGGLHVLQAEGNGISDLIQNVIDAENPPPWNLESYVSGVCLLGGTSNFGPVVELFGG